MCPQAKRVGLGEGSGHKWPLGFVRIQRTGHKCPAIFWLVDSSTLTPNGRVSLGNSWSNLHERHVQRRHGITFRPLRRPTCRPLRPGHLAGAAGAHKLAPDGSEAIISSGPGSTMCDHRVIKSTAYCLPSLGLFRQVLGSKMFSICIHDCLLIKTTSAPVRPRNHSHQPAVDVVAAADCQAQTALLASADPHRLRSIHHSYRIPRRWQAAAERA